MELTERAWASAGVEGRRADEAYSVLAGRVTCRIQRDLRGLWRRSGSGVDFPAGGRGGAAGSAGAEAQQPASPGPSRETYSATTSPAARSASYRRSDSWYVGSVFLIRWMIAYENGMMTTSTATFQTKPIIV